MPPARKPKAPPTPEPEAELEEAAGLELDFLGVAGVPGQTLSLTRSPASVLSDAGARALEDAGRQALAAVDLVVLAVPRGRLADVADVVRRELDVTKPEPELELEDDAQADDDLDVEL